MSEQTQPEAVNGHIVDNGHDLSHVADIVAAFVSHNALPQAELPGFIVIVHKALYQLAGGLVHAAEPPVVKQPAVPIKKSITEQFIICLEDGRKFKSLKRHLTTSYDLTPEQYRAKWGLPSDYPMVAPAYAAVRSNLAKASGLGAKRKTLSKSKARRKPAAKSVVESEAA